MGQGGLNDNSNDTDSNDTGAFESLACLQGLDSTSRKAVTDQLKLVTLEPGQILFSFGDTTRSMAILLSGELVVRDHRTAATLVTIRAGQAVGTWTLLTGGSRSADVEATSYAHVVFLSGQSFDALALEHPGVRDHFATMVLDEIRTQSLHRAIGNAWEVTEAETLTELASIATLKTLAPNDVLTAKGEPATSAFLIVSGSLSIDGDHAAFAPPIGSGSFVGERALLTRATRRATLRARRETTVAEFGADAFIPLCHRHPDVLLATTRHLVERSEAASHIANRDRPRSAQRIAFIGDGTCNVGAITRAVAEQFPLGVTVLTEADASASIGTHTAGTLRRTRLTHWLDERETQTSSTNWLFMVADHEQPNWRNEVLAFCDRVVAVTATKGGIPNHHPVWHGERRPNQPLTLLLVHPGYTRIPLNTQRILEQLPADSHLHLREGDSNHYARIARLLAGVPFGLVLSGGGARGFAHLGAMRSMRELEIPIDVVGGTSIGSIMALYEGFETSAEERLVQTERDFKGLFDYTLPVVSLLSGRRTSERLARFTSGHTIEDLWIPYFCVSTNLTTNDIHVHRTGNVATAIRASLALPGIFPPVPYNGDFLVDGGVLNNFPLDVMRDINPFGKVIAIDVAANVPFDASGGFGTDLSGFRAAREAAKKQPLAPSLTKTLVRTSIIGSARDRNRYLELQYADLHLELALNGVGLLDFDKTRSVAQHGYEASHETLREWWAMQRSS